MYFIFALLFCGVLALPTKSKLPLPENDPFYDPPKNLKDLKLGEVYNSRQVTPDDEIKNLTEALEISTEVHQLAYKTTNAVGEDFWSIATVFKPSQPSKEPRLFSYQVHQNSVGENCFPSYSLTLGLSSPSPYSTIDTGILVPLALKYGYYVVVADDEGPKSAYFAGHQEGHTGLDSLRAAQNFFGLPKDTATVLYGYSGGAIATEWQVALHGTYAPEINIVGAVQGGSPISLIAMLKQIVLKKREYIGYVYAAIAGILRAYPERNATIWPQICPSLRQKLIEVQDPNLCSSNMLTYFKNQLVDVDCLNIIQSPIVSQIIEDNSLIGNVTSDVTVAKFPRYIYHAVDDNTVPIEPIRKYVAEQCSAGANIQFVQWALGNHISVGLLGIPDSFRFVVEAFEGRTPKVTCGTPSESAWYLGTDSKEIYDLIHELAEGIEIGIDGIYKFTKNVIDYIKDALLGQPVSNLQISERFYLEGRIPDY